MKVSSLIKRYKHIWLLLYCPIYILWFLYLEKNITKDYYVIHSSIDDYIPFVEYFIIPYLLWFGFIFMTGLYFFIKDQQGFYRMAAFLVFGMTFFLVLSTFFPNGLNLRPVSFERDNIFVDMVKQLYHTDTATNVLPSIHVFNSLGAYIAISHSNVLSRNKFIHYGSLILTVLIISSTVFLKQHSVIDVVAGFALASVTYLVIYSRAPKKATRLTKLSDRLFVD